MCRGIFLLVAILLVAILVAVIILAPRFPTDIRGFSQTLEEWEQECIRASESLRQRHRGPHFTNIVGMSNSRTTLVETVEGFYRAIRDKPGVVCTYCQATDSDTKSIEASIRHLLEKAKRIDISFSYNKTREAGSITIDTETGKKMSENFSLASLLIKFPIEMLPCDAKVYSLKESGLKFVFDHPGIGKEIIFFTDNSLQQAVGKINQEFIDCLRLSCPGPHDVRHGIRRCQVNGCHCECPCLCPCLSMCACPRSLNDVENNSSATQNGVVVQKFWMVCLSRSFGWP